MHVPSQPLDAITAFTVPNPNCPSQSRRFFQVWLPCRLPCRADHPVYFGPASFISLTLSTVDGTNLNRAFTNVNANYWCNAEDGPCAYWEVQLIVLSSFIDVRFQFGQVFHKNLHNSQAAAKFHKAILRRSKSFLRQGIKAAARLPAGDLEAAIEFSDVMLAQKGIRPLHRPDPLRAAVPAATGPARCLKLRSLSPRACGE